KLSKRDGAKDLLEYRGEGYLPEALCNFLALIGWNPGNNEELFPKGELTKVFSLEKIQRSGGAFNEEKLRWMNREYLLRLTSEERSAYVATAIPESTKQLPQFSNERLSKLTPNILERIHNQSEITAAATAREYDWAFSEPEYEPSLLKWKNDTTVVDALPRLKHVIELFDEADFSTTE